MNEMYSFIIIVVSIFVILNYSIHLFFKNRRQKVMSDLIGINYDLVKNVKMYVTAKSLIGFSWKKMHADLIFYKKNIIIFPYNWPIKQYQPILQYTFETKPQKLNGISALKQIDKIIKSEGKLFIIFESSDKILKSRTKVKFVFSEEEYKINRIINNKEYVIEHRM